MPFLYAVKNQVADIVFKHGFGYPLLGEVVADVWHVESVDGMDYDDSRVHAVVNVEGALDFPLAQYVAQQGYLFF